MFANVAGLVAAAVEAAEPVIRADRARFAPLRAAAERVVADRLAGRGGGCGPLVVGGGGATDMLLGREPDITSTGELTVYGAAGRGGCADKCAVDEVLAAVAEAARGVPGAEPVFVNFGSQISAGPRTVAEVLPLPRGKDGPVAVPSRRPAPTLRAGGAAPDLPCEGSALRLLHTYRALADPARHDEWGGLLADERALRAVFLAEVAEHIAAVGGGKRRRQQRGERGVAAQARAAVLRGYLGQGDRPGRALAGDFAFRPAGEARRLQAVSQYDLRDEERAVRAAVAGAGGALARAKVTAAFACPSVPGDACLRRLTLHITPDTPGARREHLADIYNCAATSLVPFREAGVGWAGDEGRGIWRPAGRAHPAGDLPPRARVAGPFALLWLRFVDFWVMQLLLHIDAIGGPFARAEMRAIALDAGRLWDVVDSVAAHPAGPAALFPGDSAEYIGHAVDQARVRRRRIRAERVRGRRCKTGRCRAARAARAATDGEADGDADCDASPDASDGDASDGEASGEADDA